MTTAFDALGAYLGASFTIMVLSFVLVRANKLSTLAQHTFTATAIANLCVVAYESVMRTGIQPMQRGNYLFVVPIALGLLYLCNLTNQYRWVARYPIAVIVGIGTGLSMRATIEADIVMQVLPTAKAFATSTPFGLFNAIVILAGTLLGLSYFLFTRQRTGIFKVTWSLGRYALMIMFGAVFGSTVISRLSALIAQLDGLLHTIIP
jgi:hypothetical protein